MNMNKTSFGRVAIAVTLLAVCATSAALQAGSKKPRLALFSVSIRI